MLSEKAIIVLITVAILMSALSIGVAVSVDSPGEKVPKVNLIQGEVIADSDHARVSLSVSPQPSSP